MSHSQQEAWQAKVGVGWGLPDLPAPSLPPTRPVDSRSCPPQWAEALDCPQWRWEVGRLGWGLGRGDALKGRKPGGNWFLTQGRERGGWGMARACAVFCFFFSFYEM